MKNNFLAFALMTAASLPFTANAATINDYMRQHANLQSHPAVMSMILDWVNDPVNKDTTQSGYEMAQDVVNECAQACLAGAGRLNNEDCQAVINAAGDR